MPSALPTASVRCKASGLPKQTGQPAIQPNNRSDLEVKGVGTDVVQEQSPSTTRRSSTGQCLHGCRCVKCIGEKRAPSRPPRKLDPIVKPPTSIRDRDANVSKQASSPVTNVASKLAPTQEIALQVTEAITSRAGAVEHVNDLVSTRISIAETATESPSAISPTLNLLRSWPFPTPSPTEADPHPIIPIQLTHLLAALDYASLTAKTPIVLDKSGKVDVFFAHRHSVIVECKPLVLDVFMRHTMSAADGARVIADKIRGAMQVAAYLQFRLTDSAPNFKKLANATLNESADEIMNHSAWFPYVDVFDVKAIRQDAIVAKLDPLNHPGVVRKPNDEPLVIREGFSVVVTSKFDPEDAVDFLAPSLPLGKCQFFHVSDPNS